MGGQKFQYDESGATFFYFILSFLALILIPSTFYFWPRKRKEDPDKHKDECHCEGCVYKRKIIEHSDPYKNVKSIIIKVTIICGWLLLAFLTYKVSQFDYEMSNFDPYEILGIPLGATQAEIKKSYRKLSLILHPDKETGDEKAFMKLTKAYQALTDEEARKNWEKYGNPDGPGAMDFGIALPSWIVEKENSVWVLGLYALVFMIALPTAVGTWWYRSIRFSGDKVLLDTTQLYFYFFHKTPNMALKRVIMILGASLEFDKRHNSQVVERQSDNEEVPALIKLLPNLNEKCKELPLSRTYSLKARALLHAHLSRLPLNPETLEKDRQFIIKKCPYLIQEMVSVVNQLIMLAYARRISKLPTIETIENCMKLSPMVIQGLWEFKSPLLQLPHLTEDNLKYFQTKKRYIKSLQQFAKLQPEESRSLLRNLTDTEYDNVIKVLSKMPLIDFSIRCEVVDDDNTNIVTAGAIVTVTVNLVRRSMKELLGDTGAVEKQSIKADEQQVDENGDVDGEVKEDAKLLDNKPKKPVWLKQKAHKSKGKAKPKSKGQLNAVPKPAGAPTTGKENSSTTTKSGQKPIRDDSDDSGAESDNENGNERDDDRSSDNDDEKKASSLEDDDMEWEKFQQKLNKREKLEGKSKTSHSVHCPSFPEDKQEYWWTYICDRKSRTLLTAPYHVTNLVDHQEVQLKFTAPRWPGVYTFTVCLRSDSYVGMDQQLDLKLDVKEAAAIPTEHPQWDISESESEGHPEQVEHESEFTTDSSDAEDE
jgi:translocation protein SEC63